MKHTALLGAASAMALLIAACGTEQEAAQNEAAANAMNMSGVAPQNDVSGAPGSQLDEAMPREEPMSNAVQQAQVKSAAKAKAEPAPAEKARVAAKATPKAAPKSAAAAPKAAPATPTAPPLPPAAPCTPEHRAAGHC